VQKSDQFLSLSVNPQSFFGGKNVNALGLRGRPSAAMEWKVGNREAGFRITRPQPAVGVASSFVATSL
jgi:hypothetical protein